MTNHYSVSVPEDLKCKFPGCGRKHVTKLSIPALAPGIGGQLHQVDKVSYDVDLCLFHMMLCTESKMFGLEKKDLQLAWHGPFKELDLLDAILKARISSGDLGRLLDAAKNQDDEVDLLLKQQRLKNTKVNKRKGINKCSFCRKEITEEYHTSPPDGDNPHYCSEKCWGKGSSQE